MDGGSWFIERACHIGLDIQCSRGPLSPSVRRTEVLPVPVCPTVLSKQKFTPVARLHPAVRRECALLRDFTLALALFLGQHVRVFTPGTSPGNPLTRFSCQGTETNVPQLNTYQLVRVVVERRLPAGSNFFIPRMNDGGFQNWRFCKSPPPLVPARGTSIFCVQFPNAGIRFSHLAKRYYSAHAH